MIEEIREKKILKLSFFAGLAFALIELVFSIYSHSQSALTDAVYDASELVFIALFLFLTPLFHKPVTEKHPYGYYQLESIFVLIKSAMMLSVSLGVLMEVIESAVSGGNEVNHMLISIFQLVLGAMSLVVFMIMKRLNKKLSSPMIETEMLGWKMDILYSLGMSAAFFISMYFKDTALGFLSPYFDPLVAVFIMVMMLPESIKILWNAIKEIILFSPDEEWMEEIKEVCKPILDSFAYDPVFYDVTKTGRHLWVAVYFQIEEAVLDVHQLEMALDQINVCLKNKYQDCTCELILVPNRK